MESESLLQTLDEIGKTGLYFVEPHHQRLKRIADFIFMCINIGSRPLFGKGKPVFFLIKCVIFFINLPLCKKNNSTKKTFKYIYIDII